MKFFVPMRFALAFIAMAFLSLTTKAQSLNGGVVSIPSSCASLSAPASTISNVSAASGGTGTYVYQWEAKIAASQWVTVIGGNGLSLNPGTLFHSTDYRRKVSDGTSTAYSNVVSFLISENFTGGGIALNGYPTILNNTLPPQIYSSYLADNGSGNYSYSWELSTTSNTGPWNSISGITSVNYQPNVLATGIYFYRRKVTDNICTKIAYSNVVEIDVVATAPFDPRVWNSVYGCVFPGNAIGLLTGQPAEGGTPPYTYQWEQKTATGAWTIISGAQSLSYAPSVQTEAISYRRKASDAAGHSGYSNEGTIAYVTTPANPGSIAANTSLLIAPNAPTYSVVNVQSASNFTGGHYTWDASTNNGSTWTPVNLPVSSADYYAGEAPTTRTCYRRAIDNVCANSQNLYYTNTVCIDPPNPLTAGAISSNISGACLTIGTSLGTLTGTPATGGASPYVYQWQKNDNGNWVNIIGANGVSYNAGTLNHNTSFRRQVTDANTTVLLSNELVINLQSTVSLKGGIVDGPIVTCSGTAPGIINNILDACGGGGSIQYTWEISSNGGAWAAVSNTNAPTHNAANISTDTKYRRKVGDGCGNAAYSNEVPVYVYPAIEAGTISPVTQTVCSNTQVPEILSLMQNCHYTNGTVSYQWQKASSLGGPWTDVNSTQSFYQAGVASALTYYRLRVTSTVCGAVAYSNIASINTTLCTVSNNEGSRFSSNSLPSTLSTKGNMKLSPNPVAQGQIVIATFDGGDAINYKAALISSDGRTYNCSVTLINKGQLQIKLPLAMAKGTYLIQISTSQKQWADRIIVY